MSVGVTVHEIRPPSPIADGVRNPLADLEMARKTANEKLRIRRLMQVRQQSKDLAAKVRQGYQQAKEKELAKIEQTKQEEMKAWKRRQIAQLQDEYARCIGEVGEAHKAAEAAEECAVWFEEKRAAQQAVALARGRQAEETVARERSQRKEADAKKKRKPPYVPSKSIAVQAELPAPEPQSQSATLKQKTVSLQTQNDGVAATPSTLSPYEQFRATKGKRGNPEPRPTTTFLSSESESEDEEICGVTGRADKENVPSRGKHYSATDFTSPSGVGLVPPEPPPPPPQRLQPFTQISDLIQQRRQRQEEGVDDGYGTQAKPASALYSSYGTQKAVQFDDLSENNTLSFPTSSVMTTADDYRRPSPEDELPRKGIPFVRQPVARPSKAFDAPCSVKPAAEIKKRGKAVLPTEATRSSSVSGGASTKVQYYDCNTHFRKEYDQPIGLVRREERRADDPNAMEEASRYEKLQQELASARSLPKVDHLKPALEKQQIRKDYEKLSNELDHLTREQKRLKSLTVPSKSFPTEATIKQKAAARQRKANEAIENLLQRRTLVTCPMVQQPKTDQRVPPERPSVVNVADSGRADNRDVSSDSCTSIVLGSLDRPGIPLPTEKGTAAGGTGTGESVGVDKIGQMKALLEQLNQQRRVLMAEIDQAKTAEPEPKAAEVEQLKRRQEELSARQELLRQREREVEELGRQLREKMALLAENKRKGGESKGKSKRQEQQPSTSAKPYAVHVETKGLKEQIEVAVEQPSVDSSARSIDSSSETSAVERTAGSEIPVKIIITVNEKSSKRKERKKSQKKKSPKPVRTEEVAPVKSPEKPRPLADPVAIQQHKQPAASKPVPEDVSLGGSSTASTVYRSLPPKIGSLKIQNIIREPPSQHEAGQSNAPSDSKPTVPPPPGKPKHQLGKSKTKSTSTARRGATFNPQLMQYIVRLLGMSHQSIDQLGVSSSTVSTPNASVVNVTANRSGTAAEEDHERTARLRKFIDENYNFLQEIDETLRRSSDQSAGSTSNTIDGDRTDGSIVNNDVSHVEDVWMSTLRRRERAMQANRKKEETAKPKAKSKRSTEGAISRQNEQGRSVSARSVTDGFDAAPSIAPPANHQPEQQQQRLSKPNNGPTGKESSLKSILKSPKREVSPKVAKIITPQGHVEIINLSDQEEQAILERYSQLTERGSQRIAELSQMISQVREEKRRLVEDSLSSFEQQESTKYMDLPATIGTGSRMAQAAAQQPPAPPPMILSPPQQPPTQPPSSAAGAANLVQLDDPVSEEIDNIISSKQIGLSKDSGIAMSRPLTASDIRESPSEEGSQAKEPLPVEPFLKDIPKPMSQSVAVEGTKPYSGLTGIRKAAPPVAITRYSPQLDEAPIHELSTIPEVETPAAASSKVNLSQLSVAGGDRTDRPANGPAEQLLIEARNRLLTQEEEEGPNSDLGYERFPMFEDYIRQTVEGCAKDGSNLEKTAPGNDTTGELKVLGDSSRMTENDDERRLQYRRYPAPAPIFDITEEHAGSSQSEANGSDASLPDVVAELRKLNIVMKPFDHTLDDSNRSTPFSEQHSDTAGAANASAIIAIQRTSMVGTRARSSRTAQAAQIPTELTLGQDLEHMVGLQWASSMLRKQQEQLRKCNDNSSSSSLSLVELPKDKHNDDPDHPDNREQLGRPLNLAEFISRELMIRTQSEVQSSVSSSPVSHGTLLRSLLSISNLTNSSECGGTPGHASLERLSYTQTSERNVQRTSTPVASKSASGSSLLMRSALAGGTARDDNVREDAADANGTGGGLFSGESRISSVHGTSSSSSGNSEGKLTVPNVRLERRSSKETEN